MNILIEKIHVSALKSIQNIELECKNFNVITGTNSSGKSTLIQSLLLFFQTFPETSDIVTYAGGLNGSYISLGELRENRNFNSQRNEISIGIKFESSKELFEVAFIEDENSKGICFIDLKDYKKNKEDNYFDENILYLSCNRVGSKDVYPKNYSTNSIGINGEYAVHYLDENRNNVINSELIKDVSLETLQAQVNYWLKYIVNSTISTEDIKGTDIVKATINVGETKDFRPKNVGSGISYLLSILILCLGSNKNDIILIENPEIHLHPKAQSKVCEFLYFIAKTGRQIFIETHSDHIFNGIRSGISTNEINADDVAVNFFELDEKACTQNTVIKFGSRGQIENAPEGLFDQFDFDLDKMLGLN